MILLADQVAGRLGGGDGVDIPVFRIIVAFVFCLIIAGLAILVLRQRMGKGDSLAWLRRLTPRTGAIDVVEVRRLSMHAEIGLIRHDGQEYLLLLQAGSSTILRERAVAPEAENDA